MNEKMVEEIKFVIVLVIILVLNIFFSLSLSLSLSLCHFYLTLSLPCKIWPNQINKWQFGYSISEINTINSWKWQQQKNKTEWRTKKSEMSSQNIEHTDADTYTCIRTPHTHRPLLVNVSSYELLSQLERIEFRIECAVCVCAVLSCLFFFFLSSFLLRSFYKYFRFHSSSFWLLRLSKWQFNTNAFSLFITIY